MEGSCRTSRWLIPHDPPKSIVDYFSLPNRNQAPCISRPKPRKAIPRSLNSPFIITEEPPKSMPVTGIRTAGLVAKGGGTSVGGTCVAGIGVAVGSPGSGVAVGSGDSVGGTGVSVGGNGVFVGGTGVFVGGIGVGVGST